MIDISTDWMSIILVEYSKNAFACEMMEGNIHYYRYKAVNEIIYDKEMIYLFPESKLKDNILRTVHDAPLTRNHGYLKTYRQVRKILSWKGLKEDVLHHVRECMTCQQNKSMFTHLAGLLQPLSISKQKWDNISMEFITWFPKVQGGDYIYMVVDRLNKYAHLFSITLEYNPS
jgi:hypothetical protein